MSSRSLMPYVKRASAIVILIVLVLVIRSLVMSLLSTHDRAQILQQLQDEFSQKKRQQAYLKQKLYYAKTDSFVEEEARSKLGFVKDGESVVIDQKIEPPTPQPVAVEPPIWEKWWMLFF